MAKEISVAEALAVLAATEGIELTAEQLALAEEATRSQFYSAAVETFKRKANGDPESWADDSFALAEAIADGIVSKDRAQGRGFITEHMYGIDTPYGHLKVSLTRPQ